mmetsp:Transcript_20940/g.23211  ORF Transcript_20940/g.23211 Transcript_20940/m.23211 type:complete len:1321 (-) Transcript_20940:439-4401(-)
MSPLSWQEARILLRKGCARYLQTDINTFQSTPTFVSFWNKWDLDVVFGAVGTSVALVVISVYFYISDGQYHHSSLVSFGQSQIVGAAFIFLGCIFNIWLVVRYRYTTSHGIDNLKRRMISKFVKELQEEEGLCRMECYHDNGIDLVGTSLTDIYPVYRLSSKCANGENDIHVIGQGSWSRVPTLLLVEGDRIALQVGDTAPAKCRVLEGKKSMNVFESGHKITLDVSCGESVASLVGQLNRGRTTLPSHDSDGLLTLCNDVRIFEVLETPLEAFLREPKHESKKPQLFRQLDVVRDVLSLVTISFFLLTTTVLLGRYEQFSSNIYYLLPSPFLAAIGTSPFIGPGCLIIIEALGTARVLASYHPVASQVRMESSVDVATGTVNVDIVILRYFLATLSNRLSLQNLGENLERILQFIFCRNRPDKSGCSSSMVWVPPASLNLLEKLGVATTFTLVDDELVCEPQAIPQQLLIPSGKGLKLLDLCPTYEDESDDESEAADSSSMEFRRNRNRPLEEVINCDSDSDSDDDLMRDHHHVPSRRKTRRRLLRKTFRMSAHKAKEEPEGDDLDSELTDHEVQFEDPNWWQHLPSLKCIGLICLLADQKNKQTVRKVGSSPQENEVRSSSVYGQDLETCKIALAHLVCKERNSMQLRSLAQCIGFSTKESDSGSKGDPSPFIEKNRLHVVNVARLKERLKIDSHERGSEESRWWGLLRADSTSVIVKDSRSDAYQLLTVGDPKVVTRMCHEAWQGENSTILPLTSYDRATILETSDSWKLGDLDVEAFSYAPIPHTFEQRCAGNSESTFYLLDNDPRSETMLPVQKDKGASTEWTMLQNQIFLGILGSRVITRSETEGLLRTLQDAGVRFVYFSPRNMRRQKEIASQMGIDVAWNCAISLRTLVQGEEDEHRMISNYADWDINAKLPHGIESVRNHLKEVDNVPLLVSLFTDTTKDTTMEMIDIFQEYHDTVIAVGLSHLPRNSKIFSTADLAIGVDALSECLVKINEENLKYDALLPSEMIFASAISSHFCAFRIQGVASIEHIPTILAQGRASLAAATSASIFFLHGYLSFTLYVFLTACSVATTLPFVPILGSALYLFIILPLVGFPMTMSDPDKRSMQQVPPKNDITVSFGKKEGKIFCLVSLLKALPQAILPQLLYLIAYGELMIAHEPELVKLKCSYNLVSGNWVSVIRCNELSEYSEVARDSAVALSLAELALLTVVTSSTFVYRTLPVSEDPPWRRNHVWASSVLVAFIAIALYIFLNIERGTFSSLPWYFFILAFFVMPFLCMFWNEYLKRHEKRVLDRAEKLRRLQFETRLGMWSPK